MSFTTRLLTVIAAALSPFAALAQPVLDATYNPILGRSFVQRLADPIPRANLPIAMGANQTWRFDFTETDSLALYVVRPDTTPAGGDFPTATFAIASYGGGLSDYIFYRQDAAGLNVIGGGSPGLIMTDFSDPETVLPYGLAYNGSFTDEASSSTLLFGLPFDRATLKDTIRYLGYGSLDVNGTVYPSTILLLNAGVEYDSTGALTGRPYSYTWVAPGVGYPILSLDITEDSSGSVAYSPSWIGNSSRIAAALSRIKQDLRIWPSPVQETLRVEGIHPSAVGQAFAADGRSYPILFRAGAAQVADLPPGAYLLRVQDRQARFVKQ